MYREKVLSYGKSYGKVVVRFVAGHPTHIAFIMNNHNKTMWCSKCGMSHAQCDIDITAHVSSDFSEWNHVPLIESKQYEENLDQIFAKVAPRKYMGTIVVHFEKQSDGGRDKIQYYNKSDGFVDDLNRATIFVCPEQIKYVVDSKIGWTTHVHPYYM